MTLSSSTTMMSQPRYVSLGKRSAKNRYFEDHKNLIDVTINCFRKYFNARNFIA